LAKELKNQLGMPQEQSEEEVEEEVDTSTVFMSRYYLRVSCLRATKGAIGTVAHVIGQAI